MPDTETAPVAESEAAPSFDTMSAAQTAEYLKTGKLPTTIPSSDAPETAAESGAAPDAAKEKTKQDPPVRENRAERRIRQLTAKIKELETAATQPRPTPQAASVAQAQSAAAETKKAIKLADYRTFEEYETARDADYDRRLAETIAKTLQTERDRHTQAEAQTKAQKEFEKRTGTFADRAVEFKKTLTEDDFGERLIDVRDATADPKDVWLADAIVDSDVGPQLIHYFGDHLDELDALMDLGEKAGQRAFGRLEASDKIKPAAVRTTTAARRIGSDVGTRGSGGDTLEDAAARGDMKAYMRLMDAKEAAERRR